ncbi:MAG: heavy metal-binding domain-containing protein [Candidatus Desulfofervidaceae bacterium]|nr:heavy metal-binding domain-containing protein [Candidatus Desulfofervidaceae bacterium]
MGFFGIASKEASALVEGLYTRSEVPGKIISKSYGLIYYTKKGIAGDITKEIDKIFQNLLNIAKEKGANAVINVRMMTGSYQQQGSGWEVTYITVYGEAVVLEDK